MICTPWCFTKSRHGRRSCTRRCRYSQAPKLVTRGRRLSIGTFVTMTRGRRFFTGTFVRVPRRRLYFAGTFIRVPRRRCFLRRHVRSCTQSRWYPQACELFTRAVVSPQARSCGYLGGVVLRRHVHSCTSEPAPGTGTVDKCSQRGNGGNEVEAS